jgi:L-histidine Nalpha-methyltransferase / hercynylcysteine S-oxide synthase
MIPDEELTSKPINLRNACIFYLGHIPTFLDIHLSKATGDNPTEPADFRRIFERGIDPDVEDPEKCHAHSEIPDAWPALDTILKFQDDVRQRTKDLYATGAPHKDPKVARAMWIAIEHEAMHLETLLYMLIQSERVSAPPGTISPDFEALAKQSTVLSVDNQWFDIPESQITLGLDDPEEPTGHKRYFGWDNEKPSRTVHVGSFQAKARPITNGEYAEYLHKTRNTSIPASWCDFSYSIGKEDNSKTKTKRDSVVNGLRASTNGVNGFSSDLTDGKYVRTVYGSVSLQHALNWPVVASYDELAGCAQWMGGRIPTVEEARSIYNYVEQLQAKDFEQALGKTIPAVNGYV